MSIIQIPPNHINPPPIHSAPFIIFLSCIFEFKEVEPDNFTRPTHSIIDKKYLLNFPDKEQKNRQQKSTPNNIGGAYNARFIPIV